MAIEVKDINGKYHVLKFNETQTIELSKKLHYPIKDPRTGREVRAYSGNPVYIFKTNQEFISVEKTSEIDQFILNIIFRV